MSKKADKEKLKNEDKQLKNKEKKSDKKRDKKEKTTKSITDPAVPMITPHQRKEMIATAAYYIAERHGFTPGSAQADWQAAEQEIEARLQGERDKKGKSNNQ
jgi:hypothetical protein